MSAIDKFKRSKSKSFEARIRSVNIRADQVEFIDRHGLNLSMIVRDAIDSIMSEFKPRKGK